MDSETRIKVLELKLMTVKAALEELVNAAEVFANQEHLKREHPEMGLNVWRSLWGKSDFQGKDFTKLAQRVTDAREILKGGV